MRESDWKGINGLIKKSKVSCVFIANLSHVDPNFFYFSRLEKSEFRGSFIVLSGKKRALIVPQMEYNLAQQSPYTVRKYGSKKELFKLLKGAVKGSRIGINYRSLTMADGRALKKILKGKKFVDVSMRLAEMRIPKTDDELRKISKACSIASKVMEEVPSFLKAGKKEKEIAAEIERRMVIEGADGIAFPTIVASGPNSANPHYAAGERKVKRGDFVVVDFGCRYRNYASDMTRTFMVGKPSKKQAELYDTCIEMRKEILRRVKPGASFKRIQEAANKVCEKKFGKMVHSFGHGLGIEVHDPHGKTLKESMVVTVEPGLYVRGIGGVRIEDDVLVTAKGPQILTKCPLRLHL